MQEGKKTLWAFFVIALAIGSLCLGFIVRNRAEMGSLASKKPLGVGLLATTDKFSETNESEYFYELAELLKQHYVEPVDIDQKMASGAIRGMVTSLIDPESNFYDAEQFKAFRDTLKGTYAGIGVELDYRYNQTELQKLQSGSNETDSLLLLPEIFISSVMPGSPAERAGLKAGDEVREVQGKFIVTGQDIKQLRDLQTAVTEKKASTEQLDKLKNEIQERVENVINAAKVRNHLAQGTEGEIQLTVRRNGKEMPFNVGRQITTVQPYVEHSAGYASLRFFTGAFQQLQNIDPKDIGSLDLRNSGLGDYDEMERCLSKFIPQGKYGGIVNSQGRVARRIATITGPKEKIQLTLIVDQSTIGAAATFAHILKAAGVATIQGTMPPEKSWLEIQSLPDGSGYTLAIGKYSASLNESETLATNSNSEKPESTEAGAK